MQVRRATHLDYLGENGAEAKREGISLLLQQRVALHGTHELRLERGQGPKIGGLVPDLRAQLLRTFEWGRC